LSDAERSEVRLASGFEDNQQQSREVLASFDQLPVARARDQMVIHHPGGLHLGINDGGPYELESPLLEIPAYQVRQCGFGGHFLERFQFIAYGLSIDESPNVPVEGSEPLPDYDESIGVADCRVDFESVADYSAVLEQGCDFTGTVFRDFIKIEVVKRLTEVFPFIQDGAPAQAGLKAFEDQEFEQFPVVMDRSAPFVIMVLGHQNILRTPAIRFVFFHGLAVNG
jgi:hypothetical protein